MDPYSLGILLRTLLQSTGLRNTIILLAVGGMLFGGWKAAKFILDALNALVKSRDEMLSQTLQRMAVQDATRAKYEMETAKVMQHITDTIDNTFLEARDTRTEMHQRFGGMQEQHLAMEKQLSKIEGGLGAL